MDLNIGLAFYFAARAEGRLLHPEEGGLEALYEIADSQGRPLLRNGPAGAARGVGRAVDTDTLTTSREGMKCSNSRCGRIAKGRCSFLLCGKCCQKRLLESADSEVCVVHSSRSAKPPVEPLSNSCFKGTPYRSQARVLLVGIGADELLAGYGRHRTVFNSGGLEALQAEMAKDQSRLWQRNLGRDDRCVADSGREAWFPFIDEMVVEFLYSLNIHDIADLSLGQGVGDKRILRDAARLAGLGSCSDLVKRAIQFGTRIAKLTNLDFHGSHRRGCGEEPVTFDGNG